MMGHARGATVPKRASKGKKAARARRVTGAKQHMTVCDVFASLLAQARERLPWDESRTRVLVVISTDYATGHSREGLTVLANTSEHALEILDRAAAGIEQSYDPSAVLIVTLH